MTMKGVSQFYDSTATQSQLSKRVKFPVATVLVYLAVIYCSCCSYPKDLWQYV
jgi:hypothetical protein